MAAVFFSIFIISSCRSATDRGSSPVQNGVVAYPASMYSITKIKKYISSVDRSNEGLVRIYDRIFAEIFSKTLDSLNLAECPVVPMFEWMNFCQGLKAKSGATALTHGYRSKGICHLVLLIDSEFLGCDEDILAELVAHEMVHAYCDHAGLDTGRGFHEGWFDLIASEIERQSLEGGEPFFTKLGNLYRD